MTNKRPAMTNDTWNERETQGDVDLRRIQVPEIGKKGKQGDTDGEWTVDSVSHYGARKVLVCDHASMHISVKPYEDWKIEKIYIYS